MITLGIDIGSATSKAVLLSDGTSVLSKHVIPLGTGTRGASEVYEYVMAEAGIAACDIARSVSTGYGRFGFTQADRQISEVTCHAKGVRFLVPDARTIIDIGGQDAKALSLSASGGLVNFMMNDKCAAGTGRFLEVMSRVFDVKVEDMGEVAARSKKPAVISSTCAVFAESEVISRLASNESVEDIAAGIHASVAKRVAGQAMRVGIVERVVMSGGVAKNPGVVEAMERELGCRITVPEDCQLAGALGAALFAWEDFSRAKGNSARQPVQ